MKSRELESISQPDYNDAVDLISNLVPPDSVVAYEDEGSESEYPIWDGTIKKLDLEKVVAEEANLGPSVRARVIGDFESGVAIIMRSRNLFDTRRFGFYIQPGQVADKRTAMEVWQAPAKKPKSGKVYWGYELLDREQARPSSAEVTQSLLESLRA